MGCCFSQTPPSSSNDTKTNGQSNELSQKTSAPKKQASSTNDTGKTCAASLALEKYLELQLPSHTDPLSDAKSTMTEKEATTETSYEGGKDKLLNDITMEVLNEESTSIVYDEEAEITVFELIDIENQKLDEMNQNEHHERVIEEPPEITKEKSIKNMTINANSDESSSEDEWAEDFDSESEEDDESS